MSLGTKHDEPFLLGPLLALRSNTMFDDGATQDDPGVIGKSPRTDTSNLAVVAFISVALYNVIELTLIIFYTFKKRRGLYFWSFCVATWGIPPYSIAFLLLGLNINRSAVMVYVTMIVIGWSCTVTGQSVVLYSRLHLIDRDRRHLRFVLGMIITNAIILHTVTGVMVYGANLNSPAADRFYRPYSIVEKVQVSIFFLQEIIISGLYIKATVKFFRDSALHAKAARARILWHLIAVNVIVILLDITILGLEYAGLYQLQTAYKGMVYSIKLKIEFNILNELVNITRSAGASGSPAQDYIFDGSHRGQTFIESTTMGGQPFGMDTFGDRRGNGDGNRTAPAGGMHHRKRKGSGPDAEAVAAPYSARVHIGSPDESAPDDGIMIMRTTEVNVVHEQEFERQLQTLGRIDTSDSRRGSVDITTMEDEERRGGKSPSCSSEFGFANNGA